MFEPIVANNVKELAFHTIIWLRSSPGFSSDTNMKISKAVNTNKITPKKIIAPTGIIVTPFIKIAFQNVKYFWHSQYSWTEKKCQEFLTFCFLTFNETCRLGTACNARCPQMASPQKGSWRQPAQGKRSVPCMIWSRPWLRKITALRRGAFGERNAPTFGWCIIAPLVN